MKTLKILKLDGGIMVDVPVSICLPNLKVLHLLQVNNYANAEYIRRFNSSCLNLEELRIVYRFSEENRMNINISSPTLKNLSLTLDYNLDSDDEEDDGVKDKCPSSEVRQFRLQRYFFSKRKFPLFD